MSSYIEDSQLNGDGSPSTRYILSDYEVSCEQYELSPDQRAKFFVSYFYLKNTRSGMPFKELVCITLGEYDSDKHQLAEQAQLKRIAIEQVVRDGKITEPDKGLTTLVVKINVLTP